MKAKDKSVKLYQHVAPTAYFRPVVTFKDAHGTHWTHYVCLFGNVTAMPRYLSVNRYMLITVDRITLRYIVKVGRKTLGVRYRTLETATLAANNYYNEIKETRAAVRRSKEKVAAKTTTAKTTTATTAKPVTDKATAIKPTVYRW